MVVRTYRWNQITKLRKKLRDPEPVYVNNPAAPSLDVEDSSKPPFPRNKTQLVGQFASLENPNYVESITRSTITAILDNPDATDTEAVNSLKAKGFDEKLSAMAVAFVPLAFFRGKNPDRGINFPDSYTVLGSDDVDTLPLSSNAIYKKAFDFATNYRFSLEGFSKIAQRSPESSAVGKGISAGYKLNEIALETPVVRL